MTQAEQQAPTVEEYRNVLTKLGEATERAAKAEHLVNNIYTQRFKLKQSLKGISRNGMINILQDEVARRTLLGKRFAKAMTALDEAGLTERAEELSEGVEL